jgi:hypothetical protein
MADPLIAVSNASLVLILHSWDWPDAGLPDGFMVTADKVVEFTGIGLSFYDYKRLHAAYGAVMAKLQIEGKHASDCYRQLSDVADAVESLAERDFVDIETRPQSDWPAMWKSEDGLQQMDANTFTEAKNCLSRGNLSSIQASARRLLRERSVSFESL